MSTYTKSLALMSVSGAFGLLLAGFAQAATRTWDSTKTTGNWSSSGSWGTTGVPVAGDTVVFPTGITATYDMSLTGLGGLTRLSGSGTTTLNDLPTTSEWLGAVSMQGGALVLRWNGTPPTNPMKSLTFTTGGTIDLGGASQTLSELPMKVSGKTMTLKNGSLTTGWFDGKVGDKNISETFTLKSGAVWTVNAGLTSEQISYTINVDGQGSVFASTGTSVLGDWYNSRSLTVNVTSNGKFTHKDGNLTLGKTGNGTVTLDAGTLDASGRTIYSAKKTSKSGKAAYNGVGILTLANGSVVKANAIDYGYNNSDGIGSFTLTASGGSKLYIGSLKASGQTSDTISFNDATIIPTKSGVLIQGNANLSKNKITLGTNGLVIDNKQACDVTIAEELTGTGPFVAKMNGANFTLNNAMTTTGSVSFENPGLITLSCAQAFPEGSTVTIKFTEEPVAEGVPGRSLVDWTAGGKPANVTFALSSDSVSGHELVETTTGVDVKKKGYEPAAVAEWKGGDDRDACATTNWAFKDASGEILENGYIGSDTVFTYGGGSPRFNVTNGSDLAGHVFLIIGDVTLPAARDWSGFDTVALANGVTLDENGYKLKLSGNLMGMNDNATVLNGGDLDFTIPADEEKFLGPIALTSVTNIYKRGAGTLTATNLTIDADSKPALTLTGGKMAFDWSGQNLPTNFLASLSVPGSATLNLGGASLAADFPIADGKTFSLENGFLTTGWSTGNNNNPTRKFNIAKDATWIVNRGLVAEQAYYEGHVNGGVFTVNGTSVLGDWYRTREFHLFVNDGGIVNHTAGDLYLGKSGTGEVELDHATLDASGRTIYGAKKNTVGKKKDDKILNSLSYLTLKNGSVLRAKRIEYGEDNDDGVGGFTLNASGDSTLYIETMAAVGQSGGTRVFDGAAIVPLASGTLLQGSDKVNTKFITVNAGGLMIDNQLTNTVTIAETLKGAGLVTFNLNGADLTITEPQQCTNIKFVNPGLVKLTGDATFAAGTTITFDYTDKQFVKRSKIVTWEAAQPDNLTVTYAPGAEAITGRKLVKYPSGISFKVGFVLTFR